MAQSTPSTVHRPPSTVTFHARPQPSFNKNFNLLIRTLHEMRTSGYEIYICSDNPKQLARLQAIFKELKANIEWFPVETALSNGFIDEELKIACLTDHQIFQRFHEGLKLPLASPKTGERWPDLRTTAWRLRDPHRPRYRKIRNCKNRNRRPDAGGRAISVQKQRHPVRQYPLAAQDFQIRRQRRGGPPTLQIGSDAWKQLKARTKKKIKDIAAELIKLYAKRRAAPGHAFPPDGYLQNELEASFIYEDTPDQATSTQDVKADMEKAYPMDRPSAATWASAKPRWPSAPLSRP